MISSMFNSTPHTKVVEVSKSGHLHVNNGPNLNSNNKIRSLLSPTQKQEAQAPRILSFKPNRNYTEFFLKCFIQSIISSFLIFILFC